MFPSRLLLKRQWFLRFLLFQLIIHYDKFAFSIMETRPTSKRHRPASYPIEPVVEVSSPTKSEKRASKKNSQPSQPEVTVSAPMSQALQMAEFRALTEQLRQDNLALVNRLNSIETKIMSNSDASATLASTETATSCSSDVQSAVSTTDVQPTSSSCFINESTLPSLSKEGMSITSSVLEVGAMVPSSLKAKIKQLIFIDFRSLLPALDQNTNDPISITFSKETGNPLSISNNPPQKNKNLSMPDWLAAWNIFIAVMGDVRPDIRPVKLCKHFQQIQRLHQARHNWSLYDSEFRRLIEFGLAQWGEINFGLLQLCQIAQPPSVGKFQSQNNKLYIKNYPKGFCFKYHAQNDCRGGCDFDHTCFNCGRLHSFSICKMPINRPFRFPNNRSGNSRGRGGQGRTASGPANK